VSEFLSLSLPGVSSHQKFVRTLHLPTRVHETHIEAVSRELDVCFRSELYSLRKPGL
jgi:hypothetical protein